jgi:hypothetical protein
MAVADLHEAEIGSRGHFGGGSPAQRLRAQDAARHGPEDPGAGPSHAFEKPATLDAVLVVIVGDDVGHIRLVVNWSVFCASPRQFLVRVVFRLSIPLGCAFYSREKISLAGNKSVKDPV